MSRTAGRNAEDTRRLILDAAAVVVGERGTAVPVTEVAAAAGVSKGGLLYHFPNKEALLQGLAGDLIDQFNANIDRLAQEEPDGTPGRLTRAYIKVNFSETEDVARLQDTIALAAQLMFEPGVEKIAQQDAAQWRARLLEDGLDPAVIRLVVAAADGATSAPLWGAVLNETDLAALRDELIALTRKA
ncbi:MAG: TetR family transcriptional regulator [Galactobacter sp.]